MLFITSPEFQIFVNKTIRQRAGSSIINNQVARLMDYIEITAFFPLELLMSIQKTQGAWGQAWAFSDKGLAAINEDLVYQDAHLGFYLVCDGVGGTGAGAEASQILVDTLKGELEQAKILLEEARVDPNKEKREQVQSFLDRAHQAAAQKIFAHSKLDSKKAGACATADGILLLGSYALIAHAGPGRVFLLRQGELHQLTDDHTQLAQWKRAGKLEGVALAQQVAMAKRLTRAIGHQEQTKIDYLEIELQKDDLLFICSDGFWSTLEDAMEKFILDLGKAPARLVEIASKSCEAKAPKDNYSLMLIDINSSRAAFGETAADQKIKFTGKVPLFRFLSYQELIKVINIAELFKVDGGTTICKEDDRGGEMMVIIEGAADVLKQGKKIAQLKKGDAFGEITMVEPGKRTASIVASVPTNLLAFPQETLFALLREEPALAVKFLWGLSKELNKRLKNTSNQLVGKTIEEESAENNKGPLPFSAS